MTLYESGLSLLHYVHSRNADINCKTICKEVNIETDEDTVFLQEEDYYVTMAAASEDTITPDELLEDNTSSLPGRRSWRKRVSTMNRDFVSY